MPKKSLPPSKRLRHLYKRWQDGTITEGEYVELQTLTLHCHRPPDRRRKRQEEIGTELARLAGIGEGKMRWPDIVSEILARNKAKRDPSAPETPRLAFDDLTHTVIFDGERITVSEPKAFALFRAVAAENGQRITRIKLRERVPGLKGDKTIPNVRDTLPAVLAGLIRTDNRGMWLSLPLKKSAHHP